MPAPANLELTSCFMFPSHSRGFHPPFLTIRPKPPISDLRCLYPPLLTIKLQILFTIRLQSLQIGLMVRVGGAQYSRGSAPAKTISMICQNGTQLRGTAKGQPTPRWFDIFNIDVSHVSQEINIFSNCIIHWDRFLEGWWGGADLRPIQTRSKTPLVCACPNQST